MFLHPGDSLIESGGGGGGESPTYYATEGLRTVCGVSLLVFAVLEMRKE